MKKSFAILCQEQPFLTRSVFKIRTREATSLSFHLGDSAGEDRFYSPPKKEKKFVKTMELFNIVEILWGILLSIFYGFGSIYR